MWVNVKVTFKGPRIETSRRRVETMFWVLLKSCHKNTIQDPPKMYGKKAEIVKVSFSGQRCPTVFKSFYLLCICLLTHFISLLAKLDFECLCVKSHVQEKRKIMKSVLIRTSG